MEHFDSKEVPIDEYKNCITKCLENIMSDSRNTQILKTLNAEEKNITDINASLRLSKNSRESIKTIAAFRYGDLDELSDACEKNNINCGHLSNDSIKSVQELIKIEIQKEIGNCIERIDKKQTNNSMSR